MSLRRRIDRVEIGIQAAGDVAADLVETAGNAASDLAGAIGMAWPGGIVAGAGNLVGAAVKGLFGIAGGVAGGLAKIVCGAARSGAVDVVSSLLGALIVVAGTFLALVQRIFHLQSSDRPLTAEETARLRSVFGDSLSLYNVRIIDGRSGLFALSGRAFTLGNTIYMKKETRPSVLIHESVHVWQYQNLGPRYAMDALGAQLVYGMVAYRWRDEAARGNTDWLDFNKEAQAEHIEDVWRDGIRTDLATTSLASLRGMLNARLSRRLRVPVRESGG